MADYIYLLSTRLTPAQQAALENVREAARAHSMTVFLVGGAVRDLTSGSPIRDLDIAVQGNAMDLKDEIVRLGGVLIGQGAPTQSLYFNFPRGVRLEVGSTLSATYPQPGKPEYSSASILDDLRRRDFTANAMAISLNDGSYGLLMDPLNGVADIENRELRLVSNYGFIEDPARLIRAARFLARFGWQLEEKTQQRYENGKAEEYISKMSPAQAGYELEEIFHEEDPLRVLRRLESEGWAKSLSPAWTSGKANETELNRLRDIVGQLEAMGIYPDPSPAYFPLLTAKLNPKEVASLKSSFARPGFVEQVAALEGDTKTLATQFSSKAAAAPSDAWKMLFASAPEPVLWLAHTTRSTALQAKFKAFFNDWSQARQKIPYQLMQEMRITPELPGYKDLLEQLFFAIMDEKLETAEASKAFLEPFSPPAPPPPPNLRRRPVKRESKAAKPRSRKAQADETLEVRADSDALETAPANGAGLSGASKPGSAKAGPAASSSGSQPAAVRSQAPTAAKVSSKAADQAASTATAKNAPSAEQSVETGAKSLSKGKAGPQIAAAGVKPAAHAARASSKSAVKNSGSPAVQTPAKSTPAKPAPAKSAPAKSASVKSAPVKSAASSSPAKKPQPAQQAKTAAAPAAKAKPAAKNHHAPASAKGGAQLKPGAKASRSAKPVQVKAAAHKPASGSRNHAGPHNGAKPAAKKAVKTTAKNVAKPAARSAAKRRH